MKKLQPLVYAILISTGFYLGGGDSRKEITAERGKINSIIQMIKDHYVDTINTTDFEDKAINSILNDLDPHSSYISIQEFKTVEQDMQGSFSGIGVQFNIIDDSIVVISAISGGPSEKLGIQSGDRIVTVNKENVASIKINNEGVIKRLRGKRGSEVNIRIKRRGQAQLMRFKIVRDQIPLYSVDAGIILNDNIGYIKINRFAATTYDEMIEKARGLKDKGMQSLILDLRNNPGGYLHIANQICDEFLKDNELIVFTEGRNRKKEETYATKRGELETIKIAVLINEGSASASEIVSGALQDNDRGLVIGRRSFGKGLVQEQISLTDGSVIRLTTQRYYTPSGRCIQKNYSDNNINYYLELHSRDEKEIPDSLIYTTKNGRTVYGGGGINPDIIIERDTNLNYLLINKMISKGWVNEFCFEKSEDLRAQKISSYREINMTSIYNEYLYFIKQKDSSFKINIGKTELNYFKNLMLASISRNLWDNNTYYKILSADDEYIQRAITELESKY
ncbi:MAG: peptidase S41 [Flavobacteriales bacterium]|nr:peptidase S41 [Flavobacteriales bacterium]|tara:strand:+ start:13715 stop:15238 length:1524 start_codon:yes stop_codon:yes gene_type:complete